MQWKRVLSWWRRTGKCYAVNSVVVHSYFPGHDILNILGFLNTHNFLGCWFRSEEQQSCSTKDAGSVPILVLVFLCPCAIEIYGFSPYPLMVYFIFSSFLFCSKLQKNVIAWRANFLPFSKKILRCRCRCPRRHFCVYFSIPWVRAFQVFYQRWFDLFFLLLLFVDPSPPAALLHHEAKWLASTPTQTTMMMEGEVSHIA